MPTLSPSPTVVNLPQGHPGEGDLSYIARRSELARLVASLHDPEAPLPDLSYRDDETEVWRAVMERLCELHETHAASAYLRGFRRLGLTPARPPVPALFGQVLARETGFGLVLTDGLLDPRVFLTHLGKRRQPCTVYLRHGSRPDYTPEPDLVHEALGHAPMLTNPEASSLNEIIGLAAAHASPRQLQALLRLYWFTLEFGLVEERAGLRAYGAGLLSSFGELPYAFSGQVERRPFHVKAVIEQDYAHDRMQKVLYVTPSLGAVLAQVQLWLGSSEYAALA
jgi:phenylalanine-4-hydroxylase